MRFKRNPSHSISRSHLTNLARLAQPVDLCCELWCGQVCKYIPPGNNDFKIFKILKCEIWILHHGMDTTFVVVITKICGFLSCLVCVHSILFTVLFYFVSPSRTV